MRLNLSEALRHWAAIYGDNMAICGDRDVTYKQLNNLVNAKAECIRAFSEGNRKKIAILEYDNVEFVSDFLAIMRSGNIFVLINPTLTHDQIVKSLRNIKCDFYISAEPKPYLGIEQIDVYSRETIVSVAEITDDQLGLQEDAGVIFSSGTTGEPKALMRNSFSILSECIQWIIELQLSRSTRFFIPRPLYNTGGFILLYSALFAGGRVDLLNDISTDRVVSYLSSCTIDWAFIVPSVIREILFSDKIDITIPCNVLVMGSPIYYKDKLEFHKKFKSNIYEAWGNSEGLGTITAPSDVFERPKSIGRPFFTDFLDVKTNEKTNEGIIFGMSDNEFTEYIGNRKLTDATLNGGYIFSEDIGYKDENGYFYLTGRTTDIIIVNGIKVFPLDIEKLLIDSGVVADCLVLGIPNDIGNELVSAAIILKDMSMSANKLVDSINSSLAPHEKITQYIITDRIPKNQGGKPDRIATAKLFLKEKSEI